MTGITRRAAALTLAAGAAAACVDQGAGVRFAGAVSFRHGVASGDATADRVVIWTRVSPEGAGVIPVRWIVARDEGLSAVVRMGDAEARTESDFTVKVDVDGLSPGQRYFYGFIAGEERSPVGRTRTLPGAGVAEVKLATLSGASFPHGFFNAYEALSRRDDVDFVLHLGDYIYEYGLSGFGGSDGIGMARLPRPNVECVTLEDYRARHAQYKEERELQAAHAAFAWYTIWNDHEVADKAFAAGAENHQPNDGEGAWAARRDAALQAYYEWMPIREPASGRTRAQGWRSVAFGDLATLLILETRLAARSAPLDVRRDVQPISAWWDFKNADAPTLVPAGVERSFTARLVPTPFDTSTTPPTPITDWRRIRTISYEKPPFGVAFIPDLEGLRAKLADPARTMLGADQEQWLAAEFARSRAGGAPWQVLASGDVMAPVTAPDMSRRLGPEALAALDRAMPGATQFLDLTAFGPPLNLDAWDGYPTARQRVLDAVAQSGARVVALSGGASGAWVNELLGADEKTLQGVEFSTASVTAPGLGDLMANAPFDYDQMLIDRNRDVVWSDQKRRGFTVVTLRREDVTAELFTVSTIASKDYKVASTGRFRTRLAEGGGLTKPEKAPEPS